MLAVLAPEIAALVPEALASTERQLAPHLNGRTFVNMHGVATSEEDRARLTRSRSIAVACSGHRAKWSRMDGQ